MTDDFRVDPATEALYEQVGAEITAGQVKQGLWLKATVESGGDDFNARATYTRFRIEQLKVELAEAQAAKAALAQQAAKEREEDHARRYRQQVETSARQRREQKEANTQRERERQKAIAKGWDERQAAAAKEWGRIKNLPEQVALRKKSLRLFWIIAIAILAAVAVALVMKN